MVEYRGVWAPRPLEGSTLSAAVKEHLAAQVSARPRSRLLFVRRPDRRRRPELACFLAETAERAPSLRRLTLERHDDLLDLDLTSGIGEPVPDPLFVVCTHGKRDRCCARYGRPLFDAVREAVDDERGWQSTHVGGDRFAGNLVAFPHGLYFGRVGRADAWRVLDEYATGRVALDHYRGRACYTFPVQAAERAVRERTGALGVEDVRLAAARRTGEGRWGVVFDAAGSTHQLDVVEELGELTYLTCTARTLARPRRYVAVS